MERLAQYWDDLDDLYWSLAASTERLRLVVAFLSATSILALAAFGSYSFALGRPDTGLAVASLISVWLGFRAVTGLKYDN